MLERAAGIDGRGPGRPGAGPAGAGEVPEAPAVGLGLRAGQQRHLLARHVCCRRHSGLRVAPQQPQVCGDRAVHEAGGGGRLLGCPPSIPFPHPSTPIHSALAATTSLEPCGTPGGRVGLTLEQRVQQVLVDVAGTGVMDQEAWTKAKP